MIDLAREAGDLVELLDHRDAFDDVAELRDAADLGEDDVRERVPLGEELARLDLVALGALEDRAVHEAVMLALAAVSSTIDELAVAVHDGDGSVATTREVRAADADEAFGARFDRALLDLAARRRATDVERTHRELGARLADRLAGDDADRFADVDLVAAREVASVALGADAAAGLAGEHGADDDLFDAGFLDLDDEVLFELGVRGDDDLARERVDDVFERHAAEDAVAEGLDDFAGVLELRDADAVERSAVELGDDGVLRDVDETTREVTGVRRLERGVREALTSAVRRDEVLENRETLAEVRGDRRLDDFADGLAMRPRIAAS